MADYRTSNMPENRVIFCDRCDEAFDPYRPLKYEGQDGFRCQHCGKKNAVMRLQKPEQQPRKDNRELYLMRAGDTVKIGISRSPERRCSDLQTGSAEPIRLVQTWDPENAHVIEKKIHNQLSEHNLSGEWFELEETPIQKLVDDISRFIDDPDASIMS